MFSLQPRNTDGRRRIVVAFSSLSVVIGVQQAAIASVPADLPPQPQLMAQQIVDGLPPPPNLPPSMQRPSLQPQEVAPGVSQPFASPAQSVPAIANPSSTPYYGVFVNGDSPLLLEQVRKVESGAFLQDREGQRVIQAGLFSDSSRASQQAAALEAQGIGAEIRPLSVIPSTTLQAANPGFTQLPPPVINAPNSAPGTAPAASFSTPVAPPDLVPVEQAPREIIFGQADFTNAPPAAFSAAGPELPDNSYYVVVPGRSRELRDISLRVTQLAAGLNVRESSIVERESPLGPHVIVGPFINRSTASRWDRYFRAFGLTDSRVYYRR